MPWTLQGRSVGSEGGGGGGGAKYNKFFKKLTMTVMVNYSLKRQCPIYEKVL